MNNYVIPDSNLCTGCTACKTICRQHAISMIEDPAQYYGYVACIDETLCTNCGACKKICPVLSPSPNTNALTPDTYALYADIDTLKRSASGGAFSLLAKSIIADGGCVIGAAYRDDFSVAHILVDRLEDLPLLQRSKYLQSDMNNIIPIIKQEIQKRKVLFVGTPCQVAGVKSCCQSANLFCVDLYCDHAPSSHIFHQYLTDSFSSICQYDFRTKHYGWRSGESTFIDTDGNSHTLDISSDHYLQCFHSRLAMRKVCENCHFSSFPRQGDLSIADFWWIEETYPEYKNAMGTSAVLLNNTQGQLLFNSIKNKAALCEKVDFSAMKKNRPAHVNAHPQRDRFYQLLTKKTFNEAVDMSLNNHYDIVLWGNWSERNYGSELTYYCLYSVLSDMGYEVLMVERPKDAVWGPNDTPVLFANNPYPEYSYYIPSTKSAMFQLNEYSDTFMVGSDQIWHHDLYDCFGKVCYLEFVHPQKKKIAYSSSFGREYWDGNYYEIANTSSLLKTFNAISVREPSGINLCKELFQVDASSVVDPLFLCSKDTLIALADHSSLKKSDYIAIYVLDQFNQFESSLSALEQALNLSSQIILDAFVSHDKSSFSHHILSDASVEDWISNFAYADYVVTDSFHGMCLAIIFQKPFVAISNKKRGSTRFKELLSILHLEERLLENASDTETIIQLLQKPIDYSAIETLLDLHIQASRKWLVSAIEMPCTPYNDEKSDLVFNELIQFNAHYFDFSTETKKIQDWHTERLDHHDKIQDWHTERLDYHDKIQNWHTERLDANDTAIKNLSARITALEEKISYFDRIIRVWSNIKNFQPGRKTISRKKRQK